MDRRAKRFRESVAARNHGRDVVRRVFSESQRQEAVSYLAMRRSEGASVAEIADELDLSKTTLERWRREQSSFVLVEAPMSPSATLSVRSPSGYRVEGLSVEQAAELLSLLG